MAESQLDVFTELLDALIELQENVDDETRTLRHRDRQARPRPGAAGMDGPLGESGRMIYAPTIEIHNLGTDLSPAWRLLVDGVAIAGHCPRHELLPLYEELTGDPVKARAVLAAVIEVAAMREARLLREQPGLLLLEEVQW